MSVVGKKSMDKISHNMLTSCDHLLFMFYLLLIILVIFSVFICIFYILLVYILNTENLRGFGHMHLGFPLLTYLFCLRPRLAAKQLPSRCPLILIDAPRTLPTLLPCQ